MTSLYDTLKYHCGSIIYALSSAKTRKNVEEDFTVSLLHVKSVRERLMRFYIAEKLSGRGKERELADMHKRFWGGGSGRTFHRITQKSTAFSPNPVYAAAFAAARACAERQRLRTLLEIGCGNGDALRYMMSVMPAGIGRFIGLDLSREQVEANSREKNDPRLLFIQADADEWMAVNHCRDMLVMTHEGVLEYFSEEMVERLFSRLSSANNCILLVEPIAMDADLLHQEHLYVFGREYSFSHNYPRLLINNRFSILHQEDRMVDAWRMLLLVAVATA